MPACDSSVGFSRMNGPYVVSCVCCRPYLLSRTFMLLKEAPLAATPFEQFVQYVRKANGLGAHLLDVCHLEFDEQENVLNVLGGPSAKALMTKAHLDALVARVFEFYDRNGPGVDRPQAIPSIRLIVLSPNDLH